MSRKQKPFRRQNSSEPIALELTARADNPASSAGFDESAASGQFIDAVSLGTAKASGLPERFAAAIAYLRNPAHWWVVGLIVLISLGAFGKGLHYLEESARRQKAQRASSVNNSSNQSGSWLNAVNPFVEPPLPTATPQLSKEYIYAGSRMLAVEDANASAVPPADLAVWRPSNGYWYVLGGVPGSQQTSYPWGGTINGVEDIPVPGDYDGDGRTDFSVFRPSSSGNWYIVRSSDGSWYSYQFGQTSDKMVQADYDGDGKTDAAVFRPSNNYWYIQQSSAGFTNLAYGDATTDTPAPADYDGDGKADIGVWRSTAQTFYYISSSDGQQRSSYIGQSGTPVSADYDGDGKDDPAVRSGTSWIIKQSSTGSTVTITPTWEQSSDQVVQNDYDGDGKVDIAVWRESIGYWLIRQSSLVGQSGELRQVQWGAPGDKPVPAFYRR